MTKAIGNAQQINVPVEANSASQVMLFSWVSIVIGDTLRPEVHSIVLYWRSSANRRSRGALPITDTELNDIAAAAIIGLSNNPNTGKRAGHVPFKDDAASVGFLDCPYGCSQSIDSLSEPGSTKKNMAHSDGMRLRPGNVLQRLNRGLSRRLRGFGILFVSTSG